MNSILPGHMQNQGTRHGVTSHHEKNIRQLRSHEADFATLKSTLNDRKLFRVDPETGKPYGRPIKHKKSKFTPKLTIYIEPTFIELLKKNGYVVEDSSKTARQRAWHVPSAKQQLEQLESDSEEDYV